MNAERDLRNTFDSAAALYQAARPDYPDELYADLLAATGLRKSASLLEVGCGPGKATLPLARMGFPITAIELGMDLAAEARRNLAAYSGVEVVNSSFERWEPKPGAQFDLIYAATAWPWVEPGVRYAKAAELLAPYGHLAIWGAYHGMPEGFDPFFTEIQAVYAEIGEDHGGSWPPPPPEAMPDSTAELEATGLFEPVAVRRYLWTLRYTADEYIALLNTFSGHIAMESTKRQHLYAEIRRRLQARPQGRVTRHWASVLTIGRLL